MDRFDNPEQEEVVVGICAQCEEAVIEGEDIYELEDGTQVHYDFCWDDYAEMVLGAIRKTATREED